MSVKCILQGQQTHQIALEDVITIDDGAHITTEKSMGQGPYTLEFTQEEVLDVNVSNPNILDNADFRDPINQKSQLEYTETGYTIDRWFQDVGITTTITPAGPAISFTEVGGPRFGQNIEKDRLLEGSTYTVSLLADVLNNNGVSVSVYQSSTGWQASMSHDTGRVLVTKTFVAGNTDGELYVTIGGPGQNIIPIAAKLELGSIQTLAHKEGDTWVLNDPPPNRALELAKCQRYYNILQPEAFLSRNVGERDEILLQYPEMRISPTVSIISQDLASSGLTSRKVSPKSVIIGIDAEDPKRNGAWVYKVILDANL